MNKAIVSLVLGLLCVGCLHRTGSSVPSPETVSQAFYRSYYIPSFILIPPGDSLEFLLREWWHSREEDHDSVQVFRPKNYKLPPSRFREAYKFTVDGSCPWFFCGEGDGHYFEDGIWGISNKDHSILAIKGTKIQKLFRYKINKLYANKLILQEIPEQRR